MKEKPLNRLLSRSFLKAYPKVIEAVEARPQVYAKSLAFMRNPPSRISILEVNPPEDFKTKRLTKDLDQLNADYELGKAAGRQAMIDFMKF
jgi:predicted patatin/cPLA2 family phospholipase